MRTAAALIGIVVLTACNQKLDSLPDVVTVTRNCDGPSNPSPVMPDGLVAYNSDGGYLMVVSQRSGVDKPGDFGTWKWSCTWSPLTGPDDAPAGYAMAYDPALHMTVLIGQKTMGWDGNHWIDLHAAPPINLGGTRFVYDAAHSLLVLVDSFGTGVNTWTYDGHAWRKVASGGPANEAGAGVGYDPRSGTVLLFGGYDGGVNSAVPATWSWDGAAWTRLNPSASPQADNATMAYDEATRQMILVTRSGETWSWDGSTWTQLRITGPSFISGGLVYDSAGAQLMLWQTWLYWDRSETWTFNGTWAQLP